jgi:hypothetical protein
LVRFEITVCSSGSGAPSARPDGGPEPATGAAARSSSPESAESGNYEAIKDSLRILHRLGGGRAGLRILAAGDDAMPTDPDRRDDAFWRDLLTAVTGWSGGSGASCC